MLLNAPVVVGVDGSPDSLAAVDLAVRQAAVRHRPLRVVHAFIWPYFTVPLGPSPLGPADGGLRRQAERFVDEAVARARAAALEVPVTGEVITGSPGAVLLHCARTAALVVIGDRGLGGVGSLLIGSVGVQLAQHAVCPVLVARGDIDESRPILVGVDGSPANTAAIGYAFEAASLLGVPLVALHAWRQPVSTGPGDMLPLVYDPAQLADRAGETAEQLDAPMIAVQAVLDTATATLATNAGEGDFLAVLGGSPNEFSFCPRVVIDHAPYVQEDLAAVPEHAANPGVLGGLVRSYAGVPLVLPTGEVLGSHCAMGPQTHAFTEEELAELTRRSAR